MVKANEDEGKLRLDDEELVRLNLQAVFTPEVSYSLVRYIYRMHRSGTYIHFYKQVTVSPG